jgi:anti-sigma regulatory factor (Ser/Thr protein kinase)
LTTCWELPATARSPAHARRLVEPLIDDAVRERVLLIVSELVTNAVRYAGAPIELVVSRLDGRIAISVRDPDPTPPRTREPETSEPTGRGLHVVEAMATRWGVDVTERGKTVWCEVDVPSR